MRFQLPLGQGLKGGRMFLTRGSIVDNASGSFRVTYAPDGSHVGELLPSDWIVPPDAIPMDQTAYNTMRDFAASRPVSQRYANRNIITHNDAVAGITRTPDP
jgi:hypothetical protein